VSTPQTETSITTTQPTVSVPVVDPVVQDEVAACRGLGDLCSTCTDDEGDNEDDGQGDVLVVAGTAACGRVLPSPGGFSAFEVGVVTVGLTVGGPVAVRQALQAGAWLSTLLVLAGVAAVMAVVVAATRRPGGRRQGGGEPLLAAGELPAAVAGALVAAAVLALTGVTGGGVR
jgi:hypothetical protein